MTSNVIAHPELQKLIDKSKDELVIQCENLIKLLNEYTEEISSLSDIVEASQMVAKDLEGERDGFILILQGLQNVIFDENLSHSEKFHKLNIKLNGMSLPVVGAK